ncbi:MAG: phosphoribosylanthranilate isomerase [Niabella sp.]
MPPELKIKVCGMTQLQQVHQLIAMQVDYAGFIFYDKSPRYVVGKMLPEDFNNIPIDIKKVGVFVNETVKNILSIVHTYGLNYVQLHGDETSDFCKELAAEVPIIKAFRVSDKEDILKITKPYMDSAAYFLFDTKAAAYGGTGKKFNWKVFENVQIGKPWFLSGGIGPEDSFLVNEFIKNGNAKELLALDLNSKFETEPGAKDMNLLSDFVRQYKF